MYQLILQEIIYSRYLHVGFLLNTKMFVLILGTIVAALLFYHFIVKPYDYWKNKGVKQGNPAWVFGDNWATILRKQNFHEMVQYIYNQYQDVRYIGMYQFFLPTLVIKDPELIKQVTVKDFDHFAEHRTFIPEDVDPLWSKNLFSLTGHKWRDMRSILSPSFTSSKMRTMFVLISECADNFVQHFQKKNEDVTTIEFKDTFTRFTNDVIASTAFGIKVDSLGEPNNEFFLMGKEATNFESIRKALKFLGYALFPKLYFFFKVSLFPKEVNDFFRKIVGETIKLREEKSIVRPDMINLLLEARKGIQKHEENDDIDTGFSTAQESSLVKSAKPTRDISDLDITAQAMLFFFAGFDTVSGLMCFLGYELTANPDLQDRLRNEIKSTLEENGCKLTYEGLLKMKYMDMVVSEALRKWPTAAAVDRVCTKPYTIQPTRPGEKPVHLKKDEVLWLPIYAMHHDPEHFPDPERFDPERFSDENKSNIKPYTYFPFGLGPRNCIGSRFALLEIKTVFFYILRNFELVPVEKSIIPLKMSRKRVNMTAEGGFWFGLKRINV